MDSESPQLNWPEWMQRWDQQQSSYMPGREQRFSAMLDVLEALLPERFVAVDLACGPGSISQRLLNRFPQARSIAVDYDPILLLLGRNVLGDMQGRLRWVEADLRTDSWPMHLGEEQVDAVLSTTALHWLSSDSLVHLYHQLGKLVRPGGVVLNGDHFEFAPHMPAFRKLAATTQERINATASGQPAIEDWHTWWERLAREPGMGQLFAERERRFIDRTHTGEHTLAELHEAALRDAGFREVGVIWQHMDNRVVLGVR